MVNKRSKGTVLVTGAAKRIGRQVALHLAREGYGIALHYHHSKAEAMSTAQAIYKTRMPCELFCCDLTDEGEVLELVPEVFRSFPNLNLLINNASIFIPNQFGAADLTLFKTHWDINFKAPYILSCEFARKAKKGQVINFIDTNVVQNKTRYADYLMTKKSITGIYQNGCGTMGAAHQGQWHITRNDLGPGQ